jgi:hypothetical protein
MDTTTASRAQRDVEPVESAQRVSPRRSRIDGPHPVDSQPPPSDLADGAPALSLLEAIEPPSDDLIAAVTGQSEAARREQLDLQANQLAEHLRERLRDVDHREAQLNARVAQLESDLRAGRVWLREQEHEFAEREAELRRQLEDAQVRGEPGAVAAEATVDLDGVRAELTERGEALALKENELREQRFEFQRQSSALRHAQQLWEQEQARQQAELARERERLKIAFEEKSAERDRQLRSAEELVASQSEQLVRDRAELAAERCHFGERQRDEAEALTERKNTIEAELADQRSRLDGRAEWVERQRAGLEQVRAEITVLHRQSLEMRLVAEQLWSQIAGRMSPAEVAQSIARLRLKLAEHYRLEEQALEAKKQELIELSDRIANRHRELSVLQSGLKDWSAARQTEIEEQAGQLAGREQELLAQQDEIRRARMQWQGERLSYEQQLRELRAQLRGAAAA